MDAAAISLMLGEEMIVITSTGELGKWKVGSGKFDVKSLINGPESRLFSSSQPVVFKESVYWGSYFSTNLAVLGIESHDLMFVSSTKLA
jgi:hypothetical protein